MARTYKRDARGRFAGGGGGGSSASKGKKSGGAPKSKAASTRAANDARDKQLRDMGHRGAGDRIIGKLKGFSGSAATQKKRAERWQPSDQSSKKLQFEGRRVKGTIKRKKRG